MATLTLTGIKCFEQDDLTFDDDIQIVAYAPGRRSLWRKSMDEGQTRHLGIDVEFEGSVRIQLLEKDTFGDDNLGSVTITDSATAASDREARFTGAGGNYTVWYRVSNPASDVDDRTDEYDQCRPENPLEEMISDLLGPVMDWLGISPPSRPRQTCPMGSLTVHVKADGQPLEGARVTVREIGISGYTNADGVFNAGMVMSGMYTCEATKEGYAPNPGMSEGNVRAQASNMIEIQMGKVKVAKVTPDGASKRWYVNMPADESKQHGESATIKAEVYPKTKGVRVYFQLRYANTNRSPSPKEADLTTYSVLTDSNGIAETKINLGRYGGDWYRVGARLDHGAEPEKFSAWFQIWRKMYYEITEMKNPAGGYFKMAPGVMNIVKSSFNKVFVKLGHVGTNVKGVDPSYVENFDSGNGKDTWADQYCSTRGVPWKIHYAVCSTADEKRTEERVFKNITTANHSLQKQESSGTWSKYYFKPWQYHGDNWFVSGKYRDQGSTGSWKSLPAGSVTLGDTARTDRWRSIKVDFSSTDADPTATTQEVKLKFYRIGGINGWGGTSLHLLICRTAFDEGYPGAKLKPAMAGTSIHEPGHSLGLVYGDKPWETTDSSHSNHCKFRNCVMWWQGYDGRPHLFHGVDKSDPGCETFVREKDMTRSAMWPKWKLPR